MASSASNPPISLGPPPRTQLTRDNYPIWRSQVLPAIRGAQQVGLITGIDSAPPTEVVDVPADAATNTPAKMKANPLYADWIARDQLVLSYLLQSLSLEVLPHVHRIESSHGVWSAVEEMFSAQSEAKVDNLLVALATTKKLQMSTAEYLAKMQGFADELIAAGHPLLDRQLVSYILVGLGKDYNPLVAALGVATTPITLSRLYSQLLAYDQRQLLLAEPTPPEFESSANAASRQWRSRNDANNSYNGRSRGDRREDHRDDRRDSRRDDRSFQQGRGGGRGNPGGGRGRGRGRRRTTPWADVTCQICNKEGHYAKDCWSRYSNHDDYGEKEVHAAYGVDTNWYQDSGATHHITGELNNLTLRDAYKGHDTVNTANGQETLNTRRICRQNPPRDRPAASDHVLSALTVKIRWGPRLQLDVLPVPARLRPHRPADRLRPASLPHHPPAPHRGSPPPQRIPRSAAHLRPLQPILRRLALSPWPDLLCPPALCPKLLLRLAPLHERHLESFVLDNTKMVRFAGFSRARLVSLPIFNPLLLILIGKGLWMMSLML
ncbi:hypothetical protein QYE76_058076 [Lolium multiflorum]|uniref:CCHC-type domain-containing protein n=1 Tax=Lolium multiflorum TaxID=4521 RepID=A0AAD8T4Z9_LOLMU|nr:hypothetical protein QYE76_058076 [Lolium multiflorum]